MIDFYKTQLEKIGIEMNPGNEPDGKTLAEAELDFVILATGATPAEISIPNDGTVPIVQAVDVLLGKVRPGQKVIVVGASPTGLETADFLIDGKRNITIIETLEKEPMVRNDPFDQHGRALHKRLKEANVPILLSAPLAKVEKESVFYGSEKEMKELKNINTLVLAVGSKADDSLKNLLKDLKIPYQIIGDAAQPRTLHHAVYEGYLISTTV